MVQLEQGSQVVMLHLSVATVLQAAVIYLVMYLVYHRVLMLVIFGQVPLALRLNRWPNQ